MKTQGTVRFRSLGSVEMAPHLVWVTLLLAACAAQVNEPSDDDVASATQSIYTGTVPAQTPEQLGIVRIQAPRLNVPGDVELGSGAFLDSRHVITATHVVEGGERTPSSVELVMGGQMFHGTRVFPKDPASLNKEPKYVDVAIVRVDKPAVINGSASFVRPLSNLRATEILSFTDMIAAQ